MRMRQRSIMPLGRRVPMGLMRPVKRGLVFAAAVLAVGATYPRDGAFVDQSVAPNRTDPTVIDGPVSRVRDGDTIEIGETAIRFAKLDCAERGTVSGDRATQVMTRLVQNAHLTCDLEGRRSYDREIGSCRLQDGRDLATLMLSNGTCERYR